MLRPNLPACLALMLLAACTTPGASTVTSAPFCRIGDLRFHTDFEAASLHGCTAGEAGPVLTVAPEYAPINPSPWYAWRVETSGTAEITVRQRYLYGRHRYHPWSSEDGEHWERLPESSVKTYDVGAVEFSIVVPANGLYIAGQPLLTHSGMQQWARGLASTAGLTHHLVARSVEGRPVNAYSSEAVGRSGLVVLIGRQHPPEVTGGLAFQDFSERLFAEDELATNFRNHFSIGLVPEMNPDGVARGHWRTNQRGVDLNRDWGPFTQPETRNVAAWMEAEHEQTPLALFIDFHSTWEDVFYMPHEDEDVSLPGLAAAWRAALARRLADEMPGWSVRHNPGLPTAKSWVLGKYGVLAMTYEVGDATPRDRIRRVAAAAAEEMMKLMMEFEDGTQ